MPPFNKDDLIRAYHGLGLTQREIAQEFKSTQRVVHLAMKRWGVPTRPAQPRKTNGAANSNWRGEKALYNALHRRLHVTLGQPKRCEQCGATDPNRSYDWANISGNYSDPRDYKRLCRSCHCKLDRIMARNQLGRFTGSKGIARNAREAIKAKTRH